MLKKKLAKIKLNEQERQNLERQKTVLDRDICQLQTYSQQKSVRT